jgi:hypothetical protein
MQRVITLAALLVAAQTELLRPRALVGLIQQLWQTASQMDLVFCGLIQPATFALRAAALCQQVTRTEPWLERKLKRISDGKHNQYATPVV